MTKIHFKWMYLASKVRYTRLVCGCFKLITNKSIKITVFFNKMLF